MDTRTRLSIKNMIPLSMKVNLTNRYLEGLRLINNLMYIELKTGYSDDGPAWIGYVKTSKVKNRFILMTMHSRRILVTIQTI